MLQIRGNPCLRFASVSRNERPVALVPLTRPASFAIILRCVLRMHGADGETRISFRISILASGSTGNSTLLETERTTLLIDAGLGRKEMLRRFEALGRAKPERVDAILITHEHSDHSNRRRATRARCGIAPRI